MLCTLLTTAPSWQSKSFFSSLVYWIKSHSNSRYHVTSSLENAATRVLNASLCVIFFLFALRSSNTNTLKLPAACVSFWNVSCNICSFASLQQLTNNPFVSFFYSLSNPTFSKYGCFCFHPCFLVNVLFYYKTVRKKSSKTVVKYRYLKMFWSITFFCWLT